MIIIDNLHGGRFGNKILHYNNLAQIAKELNIPHYIPRHNDYNIFNNIDKLSMINNNINFMQLTKMIPKYIIDKNHLINDKENYLKELKTILSKGYILKLEPCLGELFFTFENSTREIFNNVKYLNPEYSKFYQFNYASIHFRGTDFHSWNPESILNTEYYMNSIEELKGKVEGFSIHTDDESLDSFNEVKKYLVDNQLYFNFEQLSDDMFAQDFSAMLHSKYIISSPSTFAICAGIMGKEKEIIHSKKWVESRVAKNDGFWLGVSNGGNYNYKIFKLV
jgi:hypothetical protein